MDNEDMQDRLGSISEEYTVVAEVSDMQGGRMLLPVTAVDVLTLATHAPAETVVRLRTA